MYGVMFGNKHSWSDFGMVLTDYSIEQPAPRRYTRVVPGRSGVLDMTDLITPNITYENRQLQFEFVWKDRPEFYEERIARLIRALHGKKLQIVLDSDPEYYYDGFVTVQSRTFTEHQRADAVVSADVHPYKYAVRETIRKITGSGTLNCVNDMMRTVPTIENSAQATITFGDYHAVLSPGTRRIENLRLKEGNNNISVTSTGTTKITYRQGRL